MLHVGDLTLRPDTFEVRRDKTRLLSRKEFALLEYFMRNRSHPNQESNHRARLGF